MMKVMKFTNVGMKNIQKTLINVINFILDIHSHCHIIQSHAMLPRANSNNATIFHVVPRSNFHKLFDKFGNSN